MGTLKETIPQSQTAARTIPQPLTIRQPVARTNVSLDCALDADTTWVERNVGVSTFWRTFLAPREKHQKLGQILQESGIVGLACPLKNASAELAVIVDPIMIQASRIGKLKSKSI